MESLLIKASQVFAPTKIILRLNISYTKRQTTVNVLVCVSSNADVVQCEMCIIIAAINPGIS